MISILAAAYGISKFFRLGHARVVKKLVSPDFLFICLANTTFLVLKGVVLADILREHDKERSLSESILWWLLFTMIPTTILVISFTVIKPCVLLYQKLGKFRFNAVADIILKQPSLILCPHITPFLFTLGDMKLVDTQPENVINTLEIIHQGDQYPIKERTKYLSCMGTYSLSGKLTVTNALLTAIFTTILLSWKGHWIDSVWQTFFCIFIVFAIILFFGGLYICLPGSEDLSSLSECIEHSAKNCLECTKIYGFFAEDYKRIIPCKYHENRKPYDYATEMIDCESCKDIAVRYSFYQHFISC